MSDLWGSIKTHILIIGVVSFISSLVTLAQPLYMMNVYDRVMATSSLPTLVSLTLITTFILVVYAGLDWSRSLVMMDAGEIFALMFRPKILELSVRERAMGVITPDRLDMVEEIRTFIAGGSLSSIFDLILVPIYVFVLYIMHPVIGNTILGCCVFAVILSLLPDWLSKKKIMAYSQLDKEHREKETHFLLNASQIVAIGAYLRIFSRIADSYSKKLIAYGESQRTPNITTSIRKSYVLITQILILAVTAYLVVERQVTMAAMFAVTILGSRTIQPMMQVGSVIKRFIKVRSSWAVLKKTYDEYSLDKRPHLDIYKSEYKVRNLSVVNKFENKKILQLVNFDVSPGELLCVVGHSGAGKSTLLKALVGLVPNYSGTIDLSDREIAKWNFDLARGHVAYLPQEDNFYYGTLRDNLTLFEENGDEEKLINVLKRLGILDDIQSLKNGLDTYIDPRTPPFSGGQKRLLCIARCLYLSSMVYVLDEPTTGLDMQLENMVLNIFSEERDQGATIIISTHTPSLLSKSNKILWLKRGMVKSYGQKEKVLELMRSAA